MQWVGRRSYALYLVHWPLVVLYKFATDFELQVPERLLLFALSIVAAVGLHELVEKPFRKRGEDVTLLQRSALPVSLCGLVITVSAAGYVWYMQGFPARADVAIQRLVESVDREKAERRRAIRFGRCNLHRQHSFEDYDQTLCATPDPSRPDVLVIGDSMAADSYMSLVYAYPEIHFMQATAGACTAIVEITDPRGRYPACDALNAFRFNELLERRPDLVLLASIWTSERIPALRATADFLHERGQRVLVIGPRAVFPGFVPLLASMAGSPEGLNERLAVAIQLKRDLLLEMRAALPDVEIIDIGAVQCDPSCDAIEDGHLLYFDAQHFTVLGAQRMGLRLRDAFDLVGFTAAGR